jgi:hypothetical protein
MKAKKLLKLLKQMSMLENHDMLCTLREYLTDKTNIVILPARVTSDVIPLQLGTYRDGDKYVIVRINEVHFQSFLGQVLAYSKELDMLIIIKED